MKVFTCKSFEGHWPVGTAAVIVALTVEDAVALLSDAVAQHGLKQKIEPEQLVELDITQQHAVVLNDGEY